jgi:hypothetical protein
VGSIIAMKNTATTTGTPKTRRVVEEGAAAAVMA